MPSCGTQTAALFISGYRSPPAGYKLDVESWDNSSWTEIANVNTAHSQGGAFGIQTAAIIAGGGNEGPGSFATIEESETWNGTAWTEVADLSQGGQLKGTGTTTSSLGVGREPSPSAATEEWTSVATARSVDTS